MTAPTRPAPDLSTCYAQVLVPVDFSALSWKAVATATALAEAFRVPYRLIHVDTSSPWREEPPHRVTLRAASKGKPFEIDVMAAPTASDGIVSLLGDDDASLLVMASHGHSATAEIALGSTAEDVLRRWRGPVVLTGPRYLLARPTITRIVAAVPPGKEFAPGMAADLRAWSDRFDVPLYVVTVIDEAAIGYDFSQHREYLSHLAELAESIGAEPVPLHGPGIARELLAFADMQAGTLLAMAPRVKPVAAQMWLGSVSKSVLRRTTNPVLLRHV